MILMVLIVIYFFKIYLNVLKLVFLLISSGILFQKPGLTKDQGFWLVLVLQYGCLGL